MEKTYKEGYQRMLEWVSGKLEYTEEEAASALGISIGQLRSLVRTHVIQEDSGADPSDSDVPADGSAATQNAFRASRDCGEHHRRELTGATGLAGWAVAFRPALLMHFPLPPATSSFEYQWKR